MIRIYDQEEGLDLGLFAATSGCMIKDVTLMWFKRDLRVVDNGALALACESGGRILPIFVVEPEYWALPDISARQWVFAADALGDLRAALARLGAPLVVRVGDVVDVFERARRRLGVVRIVSHEETGNLWTYARDQRVAAWSRQVSVEWTEVSQGGIERRMASRDGWARRREAFVRGPMLKAPLGVPSVADVDPGRIPSAQDLRLNFNVLEDAQTGGRTKALETMQSFLTHRGQGYRKAMSSPLAGAKACSRLSPYLALGCVSPREVAHATRERQAEEKGRRAGWNGALKSFQSRLAWRDHFMQKLEDTPTIETQCLHSAYESLRPKTPDVERLRAWETGETGLPFVDACMRSLSATGWLNFRMRSMLVAVASYHLWLDWRATGPHLARMFTDYEPGIHWSQMQMQSGTTGINTVRVYNPIKQGYDQDPDGAFVRRWVPELASVPLGFLQEPWLWPQAESALNGRYPRPIVDVKRAARKASDAVWGLRQGGSYKAEAAGIIRKHASRKERGVTSRFQRDTGFLKRSSDQLELDL